jgi:hypothetical protein
MVPQSLQELCGLQWTSFSNRILDIFSFPHSFRIHDTDRSGWWIIVPIVNLIFLIGEGTKGDNKFGPDPC